MRDDKDTVTSKSCAPFTTVAATRESTSRTNARSGTLQALQDVDPVASAGSLPAAEFHHSSASASAS